MRIRTSAKMVPNMFYSATEQNEVNPPQLQHQVQLFRQSQNNAFNKSNRKKDRKHRAPKNFVQAEESSQNKSQQVQNKENHELSSVTQTIYFHQQDETHEHVQVQQKPKLSLELQSEQELPDEKEPNIIYQVHQEITSNMEENTQNLFSVNLKRLNLLDWASDNEEQEKTIEVVPFQQEPAKNKKQKTKALENQSITRQRLFQQIPENKTFKCFIKRDKKNAEGLTQYNVYFEHNQQHVLTVKKVGLWKHSFYLRLKNTGSHFLFDKVASLWSTFFGNNYSLIKNHQKYSILTVSYETNLLGLNGPRKMQIYTPNSNNVVPYEYLNQCEDSIQWKNQIKKYANKEAEWDQQMQAFRLDFKGRALKPSIKNFVIADKVSDSYFIIFAKADQQVYNLDISYPFSLIQGIAVAISSFQRKLTCD